MLLCFVIFCFVFACLVDVDLLFALEFNLVPSLTDDPLLLFLPLLGRPAPLLRLLRTEPLLLSLQTEPLLLLLRLLRTEPLLLLLRTEPLLLLLRLLPTELLLSRELVELCLVSVLPLLTLPYLVFVTGGPTGLIFSSPSRTSASISDCCVAN